MGKQNKKLRVAFIGAGGIAGTQRRKLVIGFQYRYDPKTQYIKNAVDAGRIGTVVDEVRFI